MVVYAGSDYPLPPHSLCMQDALVQQVASNNKNTIVVVNSVGPINMEAWVTHPNVTAIVSFLTFLL
jgi:hypothetical protein